MARPFGASFGKGVSFVLAVLVAVGCASGAPTGVLETGTRTLRCPREELQTTLSRDTGLVREYYVGCNFMVARVHCRGERCYPAAPEPPCMPNVPCFTEDPKTLEWKLDEKLAFAGPSTH
jgi:hypothetical protein